MKHVTAIIVLLFALIAGLTQPCQASSSVNIANGNLFDSHGISPFAKMPVSITYNSRSDRQGIFGYGWQANIDIRLLINNDGSHVGKIYYLSMEYYYNIV